MDLTPDACVPAGEPLRGRGVSPGRAVGRALFVAPSSHDVYRFPLHEDRVDAEIERLTVAVEKTRSELQSMRRVAALEAGTEVARVFEAHEMMLTDPLFLGRVEDYIRHHRVNAEWAIDRIGSELLAQFRSFESDHLRARGQDLLDVISALSRTLSEIDHHGFEEIGDSVIVIAEELTPSEMIRLHELGVGGVIFRQGGHNSHAAIVARALQIPMIVGMVDARQELFDDAPVLIDGTTGELHLRPGADARNLPLSELGNRFAGIDCSGCRTADGTEITLRANIEFEVELPHVTAVRASGVGLYRSEFLYIEKAPALPTEEEHYQTFRAIVEAMGDLGATIRTFDLGGRELARDLLQIEETNPSLGLRGVRLTLRRHDLFRTQLRALARASRHGALRVMVPLVSNLEEVRAFRELFETVRSELVEEGVELGPVPLGAMVEVPAAALIAEELAAELDFLAIGTNDLIQYTLAVDRNNEHVADLYQPLHPAILRLISMTVGAGQRHGTEVSLCGEMAADRHALPILVGLGLRVFSATPQGLASIAPFLPTLDVAECRELAERAVRCGSAAEVEALLR